MTTVRLICGTCGYLHRYDVTVFDKKVYENEPPQCHGKPMLIAGEPKIDIHNLVSKGFLIDPVQNVTKRVFGNV